jgi:Fe2+ or Zn2+ uptake regulation protein
MKPRILSIPEIEERLKKAGVSPTAQRIAICRYLLGEADHPTAEQVKQWADRNFSKMSMATVYNTLGTLVKAGLIKEIRLPHLGSSLYDSNVGNHLHFVDEESGAVLDLDPSQISLSKELEKDFQIRQVDIVLRGRRRV